MKKGLLNRTNFHLNHLIGVLTVLVCPLALSAGSTAPQDSFINVPEVTIEPNFGDGNNFQDPILRTVNNVDLVYYGFSDANTNSRGIRARTLDGTPGNPYYEIELPGYTGYDVAKFDVAPDGTVYAIERQASDDYYIYVYSLSGPTYTQTDVWGKGGTGDTTLWSSTITSYGLIKVSPVSGRVFVKESALVGHVDTDGEILVFTAAGSPLPSIQINGILASTLEGDVVDFFSVPGHDGTGELWVRGNYGGSFTYGSRSQWLKVFDEDGNFKRLFDLTNANYAAVVDDFVYTNANRIIPITADDSNQWTGSYPSGGTVNFELILGKDSLGRIVYSGNLASANNIRVYESPAFRTFDPRDQNPVPNVVVSKIEQRAGETWVDVDFRVEDSNDATVETAALALPDGNLSILNALPMVDFEVSTTGILGSGVPTGVRHSFAWNAANDWNVDFGDISILILARDSRTNLFDVHLVEIPADGARPAVTIGRNPLEEYDLTMQWLWLIATNDSRISFTGGIITGTPAAGATYDGQQLTDGSGNSTSLGRDFLLELDGYRIATTQEIIRAQEGATEGFTVKLDPPKRIYTASRGTSLPLPIDINEYGIESYTTFYSSQYDFRPASTNLVYVVPLAP